MRLPGLDRLLSNVLALETEAIRLGLPRPLRPLRSGGLRERHALVCLTTGEPPLPLITPRHTQSPRLVALVDALHADPALDVQLVPVNIFWGRAPEAQSSWFRTLFADSWATPSVLKQLVIILLNGPSTLVKISPPLSLRQLKKVFGRVYLNFGEPILLDERLDALLPGWRDNPAVLDSPAFIPASQQIGLDISRHINAAADVNASNLLALVLLSTPRHAIDEEELASQLDVCRALLLAVPYGDHVTVTELDGRGMIATGERLRTLQRRSHPLGDLLYLFEEEGVLMTYFRNSTLHLFALPSLIAVILLQHHQASPAQILHRVRAVYPFLRAELSAPEFFDKALFRGFLDTLGELGTLSVSAQGRLCFDQRLNTLAGEALAVLPSGIRQAVLQVTQVTDEEVAEALQALAEKKGRVRAG